MKKLSQAAWRQGDKGKKWDRENHDRLILAHKRYYAENKPKVLATVKRYRIANAALVKARKAEYHARNREKNNARTRAWVRNQIRKNREAWQLHWRQKKEAAQKKKMELEMSLLTLRLSSPSCKQKPAAKAQKN